MVNAQFNVKLVKLEEDLIQIGHYGWFDENDEIHVEKLLNPLCNESATEQVFNVHNTNNNGFEISANLEIDLEKRILFSKIHSAGHVLDLAVVNCGYTCWKSGKGYHFPDSPYCEYQHCHQLPSQNDSMVTIVMNQLNEEIENIMTRQDLSVEKSFIPYPCDHLGHENDNSELASKFPNNQIPPYLPPGQPVRFVKYGSVECACSGTHVDKFKEIGEFKVTRVKKQGSLIKISYQVL
ncbi:hypothetical protein C9374_009559 [Naegleria lovaniensis]|uniref:Threonyl/alanyl tRNA synthetase SAD domain-containing protein n=1 Tax=Naegleria lovaniensis TaxID=51637 RepID=A0AA88H509_NAELO|nr:uncharacterized protein C9374_009559 [Naegleria lovaniensis]KAG2392982.1 hypothetical protein C9374_009559 [Naegleria lovaniensis]